MNGVLKHVIYEIGIWFHEVVEDLKHLEILLLPLIKSAKSHIIGIEFDRRNGLQEFLPIRDDGLVPLFHFFFLLLQTFQLLVDLFLHHGVEVLLLNLELLNDSSKGFLKSFNFFIKLFPDFLFKFPVQILAHRVVPINGIHLFQHLFHHSSHFKD